MSHITRYIEEPTKFNNLFKQLHHIMLIHFSSKWLDWSLQKVNHNCKEKVVIVAPLYKTRGYEYFQLDGSTPSMLNVNNLLKFIMIQLLTRIEIQHMMFNLCVSCVWTEGQLKIVVSTIYLTFTTVGTIEEKISQRQ
ncbi:hypothetical protein ACTFIT_008350 [Dictyostelium discoideum]